MTDQSQRYIIRGAPQPQGRPRSVRRGKSLIVYDPKISRDYKRNVALQVTCQQPRKIEKGPIDLKVTFFVQKPKSRAKRDKYPDRKPDFDNLAKCVCDALNGILWRDDAQICHADIWKVYVDKDPCTILEVKELQ